MSIKRGMDKEDVAYTHTHTHGILVIKRNKIMPLADTWMDLDTGIQSEISHKEKNKYCIYIGSRKMVQINLFAKQKIQTQTQRKKHIDTKSRKSGWDELGDWDLEKEMATHSSILACEIP